MHAESRPPHPVLLFDGDCGLCARSVRFVLAHEADRRLRFAPLASDLGRAILDDAGIDPAVTDTLVLRTADGRVAIRSAAVLEVARHLRAPWRWARILRVIPRPLRDLAYRVVARHRIRVFGRPDASCALPDPASSDRFLG